MSEVWSDDVALACAVLIARAILGLIFFMAGVWKVFRLGPREHARRYFTEPYAKTFLPTWSLWAAGVTVPVVELAAGALVIVGFHTLWALLALGAILVLVTFGHLLAEPLYELHTHVIPRTLLLLFVLVVPRQADRFSVDFLIEAGAAGASVAGAARHADGPAPPERSPEAARAYEASFGRSGIEPAVLDWSDDGEPVRRRVTEVVDCTCSGECQKVARELGLVMRRCDGRR